jgi:hypothetical protein
LAVEEVARTTGQEASACTRTALPPADVATLLCRPRVLNMADFPKGLDLSAEQALLVVCSTQVHRLKIFCLSIHLLHLSALRRCADWCSKSLHQEHRGCIRVLLLRGPNEMGGRQWVKRRVVQYPDAIKGWEWVSVGGAVGDF